MDNKDFSIYHTIFNAVQEAIFIHDMETGETLDVNDRVCEMFVCTYEEALKLGAEGLCSGEPSYTPQDVIKWIQKAITEGPQTFEWRSKKMDSGEPFWVEVHLQRVTLGEHQRVLASVRDITERKQAEAERERLQQDIIEAQQQALKELSTPIIPVMDRIIVMPLIGSIDTLRAKDITRSLLHGISEYRAKIVILDITGVPLVDSGVANHLNKTIQAARLKGARTIVTGVSDAVAETIVDLGIDWSNIETVRDLQTGLLAALGSLGVVLSKA